MTAVTDENFSNAALLALTKLTGEFTIREMSVKLMAIGVPQPTIDKPLRKWAHVAIDGVRRGLLVKTGNTVIERTGYEKRQGAPTRRSEIYSRTAQADVRISPSRRRDAERALEEGLKNMAPPPELTVWKMPLALISKQEVELPKDAEILHVADQHGAITLWFRCDLNVPMEKRTFLICGTGHIAPPIAGTRYLGTVHMADGALVWHVFEQKW